MSTTYENDDQRWDAVQRRDSSADGAFCYSVRTTGIYCRPSCPSRHALRKNVAFHGSCEEAQAAGFRPCLRCRPDGPAEQLAVPDWPGALAAVRTPVLH